MGDSIRELAYDLGLAAQRLRTENAELLAQPCERAAKALEGFAGQLESQRELTAVERLHSRVAGMEALTCDLQNRVGELMERIDSQHGELRHLETRLDRHAEIIGKQGDRMREAEEKLCATVAELMQELRRLADTTLSRVRQPWQTIDPGTGEMGGE